MCPGRCGRGRLRGGPLRRRLLRPHAVDRYSELDAAGSRCAERGLLRGAGVGERRLSGLQQLVHPLQRVRLDPGRDGELAIGVGQLAELIKYEASATRALATRVLLMLIALCAGAAEIVELLQQLGKTCKLEDDRHQARLRLLIASDQLGAEDAAGPGEAEPRIAGGCPRW